MRSQWNKVNNNTEILSTKRLRDSLSMLSFYISLKEVKPEDSALFTLTELVSLSGRLAMVVAPHLWPGAGPGEDSAGSREVSTMAQKLEGNCRVSELACT